MKDEIMVIKHFSQMGLESRETPFLDDTEKLDLMCEYFEIILDCLGGRLPSSERFKDIVGDYNENWDEEESGNTGYGCGCGGNCLCGKES